MNPTFSIIMTSYNYGSYVGAAIESVIAQSFGDWELIIVDDCSSDDSWEVISKYADPRICAIRFESNKGAFSAYYQGVAISRGQFLASLDSDDKFAPNKLDAQWRIFESNPDIDICGTWVKEIDISGAESSGRDGVVESWFNQPLDLNDPQNWVWQNRLCHSSSIIRRSLHECLGPSRSDLRFTPDWDLWIRALASGARFFVIQEPLTYSRQHGGNITHQSPIRTVEEYACITGITFNPYLIGQSRLDLVVRNLKGFWAHPVFGPENIRGKEKVFGNALGFRELVHGTEETSSAKVVIPLVSTLLDQCQAFEAERDGLLSERGGLLSERDGLLSERDGLLSERDGLLSERDGLLSERVGLLSERVGLLSERVGLLSELQQVYLSRSWRVTRPLRSIKSAGALTLRKIKTGLRLLLNGDFSNFRFALISLFKASAPQLPVEEIIEKRKEIPEPLAPIQLEIGQPLVSVVIPCFNYGNYVLDAIDSVLNQSLANVEIIVVDGGSTDGKTVNILRGIHRPRTRIFFRDGRHLVGDNRNYGISLARGRYICCLDADDTLDATYLEKAAFYLETYGYDIVSTSLNFVGAKEGHVGIMDRPGLTDLMGGNQLLTCAVFRRRLWEVVGGYFDVGVGKHHVAEDWDFWVRLAANGARIRNISGEYLFNYRIHEGGSLSSSADVKPLSEQREAILERNHDVLNPAALKFSEDQKSRCLRCEPTQTALASCVDVDTHHRMTLLLAMPYFLVGGAERLLSGLCEYLASHGWRVIVIATLPQESDHGTSIDWFKASTSEVYSLPRFLEPEERADFVAYLLASRHVDCLLNTGSRLVYELLPSLKKNNPDISIVDFLFNTVGHVESHLQFKESISYALAENQEVFDWYLNVAGWPRARLAKVSSGVDLNRLSPGPRPKALVDKYGIDAGELVVGFSGRFSDEKAPDVFVEVANLCRKCENVRFVMTGAGPLTELISRKVEALPTGIRFEFAGLVDDVDQYLALYDVLILPSRFDGRPLVVMEALACGVPVIASDVGGLPDLVSDGKNGFLVPPADEKAIADRIVRLAEDRSLLAKLKEGARTVAEEKLDANMAYRDFEGSLRKAIEAHIASD